ncbi:hypothetical protein [Geodermatophilus sp. URMC 60]
MPDPSAPDAARRTRRLVRARRGGPQPTAVARWVARLARLDSWSPDSSHPVSPRAARRALLARWTRSGELTEVQARVLLTLDETTPWQI